MLACTNNLHWEREKKKKKNLLLEKPSFGKITLQWARSQGQGCPWTWHAHVHAPKAMTAPMGKQQWKRHIAKAKPAPMGTSPRLRNSFGKKPSFGIATMGEATMEKAHSQGSTHGKGPQLPWACYPKAYAGLPKSPPLMGEKINKIFWKKPSFGKITFPLGKWPRPR